MRETAYYEGAPPAGGAPLRNEEEEMRVGKIAVMCLLVGLVAATASWAGDFDWLRDLNVRAQADPSGFKAQLATRFKIGNAEVSTVISNVRQPADAYMMLRLSEMSGQPVRVVQERYAAEQGKGWGALARSLGIKPGSREFHELKRGHDLHRHGGDEREGRGEEHGHGHGHGRGHDDD